jgi:NAD(P)-dependent dehydrogenase (short-subunit alcohol dehydrogenase family)
MSGCNASKGTVRILTEALSVELAPHDIRVNSISPDFIDSEQIRLVRDLKSSKNSAVMDTAPPLARIGNFNDLMGAVIYLLSDVAAYTNGADIAITRGLNIGRIEL